MNFFCLSREFPDRIEFAEGVFLCLNRYAGLGSGILWERSGLVGRISNAQLLDLMRVWGAYRTLVERGRLPEVPPLARGFDWCETTDHFTLSEQGKQLFDPQPSTSAEDGRTPG